VYVCVNNRQVMCSNVAMCFQYRSQCCCLVILLACSVVLAILREALSRGPSALADIFVQSPRALTRTTCYGHAREDVTRMPEGYYEENGSRGIPALPNGVNLPDLHCSRTLTPPKIRLEHGPAKLRPSYAPAKHGHKLLNGGQATKRRN